MQTQAKKTTVCQSANTISYREWPKWWKEKRSSNAVDMLSLVIQVAVCPLAKKEEQELVTYILRTVYSTLARHLQHKKKNTHNRY
jgi:hypothetical protein